MSKSTDANLKLQAGSHAVTVTGVTCLVYKPNTLRVRTEPKMLSIEDNN